MAQTRERIGGVVMSILHRERLPPRKGRVPLEVVLATGDDGKYVTWLHDLETGGYFEGHYFEAWQHKGDRTAAYFEAFADFKERVDDQRRRAGYA
jgi:hypothetical protein